MRVPCAGDQRGAGGDIWSRHWVVRGRSLTGISSAAAIPAKGCRQSGANRGAAGQRPRRPVKTSRKSRTQPRFGFDPPALDIDQPGTTGTTFSKALANALRIRLRTLTGNEPEIAGRIAVHPVTGIGYDLYTAAFGQPNIAPPALIETLLRQAAAEIQGHRFSPRFLIGEWREVVDAWQLASWEDYRDVARLGRKTRIGGKQREILWSIFERVRAGLAERKAVTWPDLFGRVAAHMAADKSPFDFVVVDEAQDVGVAELRFLASLAANRPDGLFFAGDLGQRIFQQPFSWRSLGVDVRGRSYALRINYRTSHQIRAQADRLLPSTLADVDGSAEDRRGTVSVFNGPAPAIETFDDPEQEAEAVGAWIAARIEEGVQPHEIGVFVRSARELRRARNAVKRAGVQAIELTDSIEVTPGKVSISTMHLAKGLEFRAVAVMACDDERS